MNKMLHEILGWYGVAAVMSAYALLSFGALESSSVYYQLLNFTGAIGIAIDAYYDGNTQPVVLNIVWGVIALVALVQVFLV